MTTEIREPNFSVDLPGEWEQDQSIDPATLVFHDTQGDQTLSVSLLGVKPVYALADRRRLLEDYLHHRSRYEKRQRQTLEQTEPVAGEQGEALVGEWTANDLGTSRRLLHHVVLAGSLLADFVYEAAEADEAAFRRQADAALGSVAVSE